jgi:hypothetical protein
LDSTAEFAGAKSRERYGKIVETFQADQFPRQVHVAAEAVDAPRDAADPALIELKTADCRLVRAGRNRGHRIS